MHFRGGSEWDSLSDNCFELLNELIVLLDCSLSKVANDAKLARTELIEILLSLRFERLNEIPDFIRREFKCDHLDFLQAVMICSMALIPTFGR